MWVFRYYARENGRRVYKKVNIGSVLQLPKRKDAERQVAQLRIEINSGAAFVPMNMEQLSTHFENVELPLKSYATRKNYKEVLDAQILPRWGRFPLSSIRSVEVESWLRSLKRRDGASVSPATGAKIRNVMSAMFSHAIRNGWASSNPITPVRTSAKRMRTPDILSPGEFQALLQELPQRERAMVLLAGSTGLRRGELIALRWEDIDFGSALINVTHSIWHNVEGPTKTEASRKPVPVPVPVLSELKAWRDRSAYKANDEFLFPSIQKNGGQPLQPETILNRYIRPALKRLGIEKRIGWHSFRHGLATLLRQQGVDVKTAQELLRHANSRITVDIYQQAVPDERRFAQNLAFEGLIGTRTPSTSNS